MSVSGIHYVFIARDSDMVVFERLVNKKLTLNQLNHEAIEIVTELEKTHED